jgi:serine/threonine protein kinase
MTPDRRRRIEELYHAALTHGEHDRLAFLAHECAGDEILQKEVESLLAQPASARGFLEGPAVAAQVVSDMGASVLSGQPLGTYQVHERIGVGGMGEVYRARDTKLGRDVAIKILPRLFTNDPERLARFEREARILASLNHPHIGAIYGFEEADGLRALVLELVEGDTLADRVARGPIPVQEALTLAQQIADALDAAHEKGIIHRDLKPANIKITPAGVAKVLDFGLAKAISADVIPGDLTQSPTMTVAGTREGVILGTAAYMSPEQARGQTVDRRADIWAFGCVLYEMLTGRSAFARDTTTDTLAAVVEGSPNWSLLSATPPTIGRLVQRCLKKDVRHRLHDIADARIELDDALSGEPGPEAVPTIESRRRPISWAVVTAGAIAAAGIGAVIAAITLSQLTPVSPSEGAPARTIASQLTNYGGTESGGALSPDGRSFVFVSNHGGTPDLYLRQVSGGEPVRLTNDAAEEALPAFAPDGDRIYFTRIDEAGTGIWRTGVLGGEPRKVLDNAQTPALSPDGKRLAYVARGNGGFNLGVLALDGSGTRTLVERIRTGTFRPAWSHDGRWVTYSNWPLFGPTDVFVVDAATGQQRRVAQLPPPAAANDGGRPVWLPDNRHLVISYSPLARQDAPADLWTLRTKRVRRRFTSGRNPPPLPSGNLEGSAWF